MSTVIRVFVEKRPGFDKMCIRDRSKMNRNSVVWAVLCGLLGIIPMIIYLCVRNNPSMVPIYCSQCGRAHVISEPCCPFCHQENPYSRIEVANPRTQEQHKRAKVCLIIGICLLAAGILAMVICLLYTSRCV